MCICTVVSNSLFLPHCLPYHNQSNSEPPSIAVTSVPTTIAYSRPLVWAAVDVDDDVAALETALDADEVVDDCAGFAVEAAVAVLAVAVAATVDVDADADAPDDTSRLLACVQTPVSVESEAAEARAAGVEPQLVYWAIQTTLSVWSITTGSRQAY